VPPLPAQFAGAAGNVPSRLGMLIIYALGLVASIASLISACREPSCPRAALVGTMLTAHYLKRELEVFFVHRYSGKIDLATSCAISLSYGLATVGIMHYSARERALGRVAIAGAVLFGVGAAGNAWHHWLLAALRSGNRTAYAVPRGALFGLVACPHYLMELVAWLGIAMASSSLFAYLNFASMSAYLMGRAISTRDWYRRKFGDEYPAARKALVPYVF